MRRTLACGLMAALVLPAVAFAGDKWAEHTGDIPFVIGYENGKKESEFSGRPMMIFFTATW